MMDQNGERKRGLAVPERCEYGWESHDLNTTSNATNTKVGETVLLARREGGKGWEPNPRETKVVGLRRERETLSSRSCF